MAAGEDQSTSIPLVVCQWIFVDRDCYFIIQGLGGAERKGEYKALFQNMAMGFRRRPSEPRPVVAEESPPRESGGGQSPSSRSRVHPMPPDRPIAAEPPRPFEPHDIADDRPEEARRSDDAADRRADYHASGPDAQVPAEQAVRVHQASETGRTAPKLSIFGRRR